MDVLIIKLGALGDVINTLPFAWRLKNDFNAKITWIVEPLSYPLIVNNRVCDNAVLFNKNEWRKSLSEVLKKIEKVNFDLVIDLQRILKSSYFTIRSNGKRKITFDKKRCKEMTWVLPYEKIPAKDHESNHMLDQYMEFYNYLGGTDTNNPTWNIEVKEEFNFTSKPYVVLNTGATKPANKWFQHYFSKLVDLIYEKTNLVPVLTGGPEDIEFSKQICNLAKIKPIDLTGKTSILQLISVLNNSSYIISCDTGPMHLGVALNKKVCALFGPSNPVRTGPYYGKVVRNSLKCSPCNKKRCEKRDCMDIDPKLVFKAVFEDQWKEKKVDYVF